MADVITIWTGVAIAAAISINIIASGLYWNELSEADGAQLALCNLPRLRLLNFTRNDIETVCLPVLAPCEGYGYPAVWILAAGSNDSAVNTRPHNHVATDT